MKNLKKVLVAGLAALAVMSFVACSGENDDNVQREVTIGGSDAVLAFAPNMLPSATYMDVYLTNISVDADVEDSWWWGTYTSSSSWKASFEWQSGEGSECIYKATVTVADYPDGLYIGGVKSTVTVTVVGTEIAPVSSNES